MILLLGATSYIGQAFARALRHRADSFVPLSQDAFDYTRFEFLFDYVRKTRPDLIIHVGEPDTATEMDANGAERGEMFRACAVIPQTVARVAVMTRAAWAHVAVESAYSGARVLGETGLKTEPDLSHPDLRRLFDSHPEQFIGFTESDPPNNSLESAACTFAGATLTLAEEALRDRENGFVWRFGQPFNEEEHSANLLAKLHRGAGMHDRINSLSHIDDCVAACLELWERRSPFGIYNVVHPGAIATRELLQSIWRVLGPRHAFQPRLQPNGAAGSNGSNGSHGASERDCILDGSKLARAGVKLRPVREAVGRALEKWKARDEAAAAVRTAD